MAVALMSNSESIDLPRPTAYLLAVVEVDKNDRIQCQVAGCGRSVYKRIHVVLSGLEFQVLGSECYQRLYGQDGQIVATPQYGPGTGRLLTAEERMVLVENTARFIETLEAERLELERLAALEATRREQEGLARIAMQREAQKFQKTRQFPRPLHIPDDARSASYDGPEMLRWRWKNAEERSASIADYEANPTDVHHHASVMHCLKIGIQPTPYQFALKVELSQCLPKRYIFRALDELSLIERM
jgi:hypothetical protein